MGEYLSEEEQDHLSISLSDGTFLKYQFRRRLSIQKPQSRERTSRCSGNEAKRKMRTGAQLLNSVEETENYYSIPLWAVNAGKPAVVAYLWIFEGLDKNEIAKEMSLTRGSVNEYIRRVREDWTG